MFGLTSLGFIHTAISLVAVFAGVVSFIRFGRITGNDTLGRVYVWFTVATCVTALGIFQHGGFGKPHALAILTLLALAVAAVAERTGLFRSASRYVATISYTATFLFHMIPAVTETFTRVPAGSPVFANADAPGLQKITGLFLLLFLAAIFWQVRRLRAEGGATRIPSRSVADIARRQA